MQKSKEDQVALLKKIVNEKKSEFLLLNQARARYCGGDMDCDTDMYARYMENNPEKMTNVSINDEKHKNMVEFQLNLLYCPLCLKDDIYLTKFNNVGDYKDSGFGYRSVDME